jgi:hypothetical protein
MKNDFEWFSKDCANQFHGRGSHGFFCPSCSCPDLLKSLFCPSCSCLRSLEITSSNWLGCFALGSCENYNRYVNSSHSIVGWQHIFPYRAKREAVVAIFAMAAGSIFLCCWLGWWGWRSKSHISCVARSGGPR